MSNTAKKHLSRPKRLMLLSLVLFFPLITLSFAADISEFEKYKEKEYGPEYFYAIEGEVYGQAAPGVQAVYVNNKPVRIDKNLNFRTKVALKKGQKYLTIETRYQDLHFTKKYLVIRHPKAPKTFKIHVPRKEFQKIIARKPVPKRKIPKKPRKPVVKKPPPIKKKWLGYEFIAELEPGRLLLIRNVDRKYFALIYVLESKRWIPLHKISHQEFKDLLEKGTIPPSLDP